MSGLYAHGTAASGTRGLYIAPPYVSMLTLETGAIVPNADTYALAATVATHATRYGLTWTGTDLEKEQAILRAMRYIDDFEPRLLGWRVSSAQALAWPRYDVPDNAGGVLASDAIPAGVINALCEAAILERATPGALIPASNTADYNVKRKREKVGPVEREIEYAGGVSLSARFDTITALLRPFMGLNGVLMQH